MDEKDVILSFLLLSDSRVSIRELADRLDLSANAVHKRIQQLIDASVIRKFTTKISLIALQASNIIVHGRSEAETTVNLNEKLGKNKSIYWVALGGGNYIYVGAYLKNMTELTGLTDFIKKEAQMPNPNIGIMATPPSPTSLDLEKTLYPLDREIIYSLSNDSRKPIAAIADELGVAAKTVRRRLAAMMKKGLLEFSIHWFPDASDDIFSTIHIKLKPAAYANQTAQLTKKYFPNMLFYYQFVNLPNEIICILWTNTMKKLKEIQQRLVQEEVVASIVSNILYTGYIFDTWRDEIVRPPTLRKKKT
jgi:DNA-binding Lrp family transcriptional regulator